MLLTAEEIRRKYAISRTTLISWEKDGLIEALRTPKGRRRYPEESILRALGITKGDYLETKFLQAKPKPSVVLYARVSSRKHTGFLEEQVKRLRGYADSMGWNYELVTDIGSALKENRRGLRKVMQLAKSGRLKKLVALSKDRLAKIGRKYLEMSLKNLGVALVYLEKGEVLNPSTTEEFASDISVATKLLSVKSRGKRSSRQRTTETSN